MRPEALFIPSWMPPSAAERARFLWPRFERADDRARLRRLASDLVMKTEVWPRLPSAPEGLEGQVLEIAFQVGRKDFADYVFERDPLPYVPLAVPWRNGPPLGLRFHQIAELAATLRDALVESGLELAPCWTAAGGAEAVEEFAELVGALDNVRERYAARQRDWAAALAKFPRCRKRNSPKARQWLFVPLVAYQVHALYGRAPTLRVVAALTQVVFDLSDGVDTEAVRSLLRAYRADRRNRAAR